MEQNKDSFKELLAFGEEGEKEVATYLISKGINILPLYQFTPEQAPKILNINNNFTSPDLTCFKDGKCFFVEVKSKRRWTICPNTKRIETGCDYRLYKEYINLCEQLKLKIYLVFNHIGNNLFTNTDDDSNGIFIIDICNKGRYWDGINKKTGNKIHNATYFWEYKQLKQLKLI